MSNLRVSTRNGWFRIVNSFHIALSMAHLTGNEYCVFGMLIRYTYGNVVRGNDGALRGTDRCDWSVRIAAEESHLSKCSTDNAWRSLVKKKMVICYQPHSGQKPGVWGPNEEFWNWQNMPSHFSVEDILKRSGKKFCVPNPQDAKTDICVLDSSICVLVSQDTNGDSDPLETRTQHPPKLGHKTSETRTQHPPKLGHKFAQDAVQEGICEPSYTETRDKRDITTPHPHSNHSDKNRKVEVEEIDEFPTNVVPLNLTVEQSWKNSRSRFRNEAQSMLSRKLSFGGLPLWATQDLDKVIDANPPQDWTPKRWFTLLRELLSAAVFEAEQAWIKSQSSVRSGLRLCLSRWKTSVAVATSGIPQTQNLVQA